MPFLLRVFFYPLKKQERKKKKKFFSSRINIKRALNFIHKAVTPFEGNIFTHKNNKKRRKRVLQYAIDIFPFAVERASFKTYNLPILIFFYCTHSPVCGGKSLNFRYKRKFPTRSERKWAFQFFFTLLILSSIFVHPPAFLASFASL